jgi:Rrf2 family protein
MKLSTRSRYGARLLLELALNQERGPVQISEIAAHQKISIKYLEQLIRPLKKAHLVISARGPKGGHMLAQKPEKITLGQIVRIFEGQSDLVECISAPDKCVMSDDCRMRIAWEEATQALFEKLDGTTIADLMDGRNVLLGKKGACPPTP